MYIATYHQREGVAFGLFKRDALLYKSLALAQAGALYAARVELARPDWASLGVMGAGFALASLATEALGWDRTYFGWELGAIEGEFVTKFPYGTIPHPMIVGGITGWAGFHMLAAFRADYPWLVPTHVAMYLIHCTQEHLAIYSTGKIQSAGSA